MRATARAHNVGVMLVEFPGDPLRDPHEEPVVNLIWATRGRTWGFRFLLDGEYASPLATYESAFVGTEYDDSVFRRSGDLVALRFPDPEGRTDAARRIIPHDFVVGGQAAASINSAEEGLRAIWPMVANVYASVWDGERPPSVALIRSSLADGQR
ncbi:hypothetical protein MTsN4n12_29920 [Microbacterium sp. MTN4-12]